MVFPGPANADLDERITRWARRQPGWRRIVLMAVIEKAGTAFWRVELSIALPKLIKPVSANFIAFSQKMDKIESN